jgi:transposase
MDSTFFGFDPDSHQVIGPAGVLPVAASDLQTTRFLMLLEGECLNGNITSIAEQFGISRQRYYQLLDAYLTEGLTALEPQKTGPKSNYRRGEEVVRQILRYLFLDTSASPEVITQKLNQAGFPISLRTVHRVIADYGLQKKTLRAQPQKPASASAHPTRRKPRPPGTHRRSQRRTGGASNPGR